jgi:hypothetical protein
MADSPEKRGAADRRRVAGDQDYEVSYFAKRHGITIEQAKMLIQKFGNDRAKLDAAAAELKGGRH